jgi:hypothetical protein
MLKLKGIHYNFYEKALLLAFVFTTFSGAIRKWGTSSGAVGNAILFVQLLTPWLIFIFFYARTRRTIAAPFLAIYLAYLVLCALNPMNLTVFHGSFGIILHAGFWLGLFAFMANRDKIDFTKLIPWFLLISGFQLALGILQYLLPGGHVLNRYVKMAETERVATVGTAVRVTGTFSYIGGYTSFILFMIFFAWFLAISNTLSRRLQFVMLFGALFAGLMNGSRSIIVICLLFTVLIFISTNQVLNLINGLFFSGLLAIGVYSYSSRIQGFVENTYKNFMTRVDGNRASGEEQRRILGPLDEIVNFRGKYITFGIGLGATYQGAQAIWGESWYAQEYGGYEEEAERIILEGGMTLFFLRCGLFLVLLYHSRIPIASSSIIALLCIFYIPIVFNIYNLIYIFIGLAMLDSAYAQREKQVQQTLSP